MDNPPIDEHATVFPVPMINEVKRFVVRVLFNVDPHVQFVPKVKRIRQ